MDNQVVKSASSNNEEDPVRQLLKQIWKQHNSIVQGLKAELYDTSKKYDHKNCQRCKELDQVTLNNNSLKKLLKEKEKIILDLENKIQILDRNKNKSVLVAKENKNAGDKKVEEPLVQETQECNANIQSICSQNPVVMETMDPASDIMESRHKNHVLKTIPSESPSDDDYDCDETFVPDENLNKCDNNDSPSLLFNPNKSKKIGYVNVEMKHDKDNIVECSPSSSGFLSSFQSFKNFGANVSKSPKKAEDISFSPRKRKSRKNHLKQTTLKNSFIQDEVDGNLNKYDNINNTKSSSSNNSNDDKNSGEDKLAQNLENSNKKKINNDLNYKYVEVVRKKDERRQLDGFDCHECREYYKMLELPDDVVKGRMKKCSRHRAKFSPPKSPDHFWDVEFPSTQQCIERGYMNKTQQEELRPLKRRRPNNIFSK